MPSEVKVTQVGVKVGGSYLQKEIMDKLLDVEVDTSFYVPSMFVLRFDDDDLSLVDNVALFDIGKPVEIELPDASPNGTLVNVIKGEITSIEPDFNPDFSTILTIRGYDKGYRLNRGTYTRVFQNMTDSDIVRKIASEAKLKATVDVTAPVHDHVFQHNQTDYAFLRDRARRNNFELIVNGDELIFRKGGTGDEISLVWGHDLRSFYPRASVAGQVTGVEVRGWDIQNKKELSATAKKSDMPPKTGIADPPETFAKKLTSGEGTYIEVHQPVRTQSEADKLAQALLDEIDSGFIEAEGTAFGNGKLVAGKKVKLTKLGKRFSGTYFVTAAVHTYSAQSGYDTRFTVEGVRRYLTADLVNDGTGSSAALSGVFSALVTSINDPDNMGRVKLKFPWLDPNKESTWARMSTVGGGAKQRGFFWMPEVNDEVLVAFEHGNFDQPYILGGLYNGQDKPPATASQFAPSSSVELYLMQTNQHLITVKEAPAAEMIELKDKAGKAVLRLTSKPMGKIEILCTDQEIDIECAKGMVNVKAMNIVAKATNQAEVSAVNVKVEATANLDLKGGIVNMQASGALTIRGSVVNIN